MEQVNAEYTRRVANILDDTVRSLQSHSDGASRFDSSCLADGLRSLRDQMFDTLSLTLANDLSLKSDIRKFECERSTKNAEFEKLEAKLISMQQEREERRTSQSEELQKLKTIFEEKHASLTKEQDVAKQRVDEELESGKESFDKEWKVLQEKRIEASEQRAQLYQSQANKESQLQTTISSLEADIAKLSQDHETAASALALDLEAEKALLGQRKTRRSELEEHFALVDRNVAVIEEEQRSLEAEQRRRASLHNGAVGLQRLWRGAMERDLVAKMKLAKKKKKGKKKGKKKK